MTLNQLLEGQAAILPPTDARLRPDIRLMEEGNIGKTGHGTQKMSYNSHEITMVTTTTYFQHCSSSNIPLYGHRQMPALVGVGRLMAYFNPQLIVTILEKVS
jgi:hypothetical protein